MATIYKSPASLGSFPANCGQSGTGSRVPPKRFQWSHLNTSCSIKSLIKLKVVTIRGHANVLRPNLAIPEPVTGGHLGILSEYTSKPIMRHINLH